MVGTALLRIPHDDDDDDDNDDDADADNDDDADARRVRSGAGAPMPSRNFGLRVEAEVSGCSNFDEASSVRF